MTALIALNLQENQLIATGLFIVGVVFISAWLLMRIRKRNLRGPGYVTAQEHLERYKQKDAVRNDLEGLMVDIEQLAKRLGAQLDAKTVRLERLIDDADLRIAQLQQADRQQHAGLAEAKPGVPAADAATTNPGSTPKITPTATPESTPEVSPASEAADPLTVDVYRLADDGLAAPQIARELDEHVGKVELILALRQA